MRRRIWVIMVQIDGLTSYQLGLPPMIQESLSDVQKPRNLQDEDFEPDSAFLPPSRPATELTPILYVVVKADLAAVFRNVYVRVALGRTESYDEIIALDRRLESARGAVSPRFRGFDLSEFVTESPYVMIRRYMMEMLYLKTVCMLHRHHMTLSYKQPEYSFSRLRCLDASMSILKHHADILRQMQTGGLLHRNTMFASSIEQADFLLASILVCVEHRSRAQFEARPEAMEVYQRFRQGDLLAALQRSHEYLGQNKDSSKESQQAYSVLSTMLRKFSETSAAQNTQQAPAIHVVPPACGSEDRKLMEVCLRIEQLLTSCPHSTPLLAAASVERHAFATRHRRPLRH